MLDALNLLAAGMEYAGDLMLCLGAAVFAGLVAMDDGLK
jgi:hypothetical protein